jgi:hypothetical protein
MRFLIKEAERVRRAAYERGNGHGPDASILEAFLLLHKPIGAGLDLAPMDDLEANAVRYQLKQELIGKNAHQQAA